ncbi:MAG: sugar phosphate isomerase/epimerase [Acidobacteriota bacterium]|nr:sugar phosphate isomerase/epimerase [Acidobacteriota bacterium]
MNTHAISRRSFLAFASAAPLAAATSRGKRIPIGLELYSVRDDLKKDLMGTVRAVAKLGYEGVEFYAPYYDWTVDYAKEVRKLLDDLGVRCFSTHNSFKNFIPENLPHAIELNQTIGSKFIVMASAGKVTGLDGWKAIAESLNRGAERMKPAGLRAGYHNHNVEFEPIEGKRPMEVLAANTAKDVALQLDVGACLEAGADPVAWIEQNPGRIKSLHCKDWSPEPGQGFKVLIGEGVVPWKKLLNAAVKTGGVEYYLIEQEGSAYAPLETVERCLVNFRKLARPA